MTRPEKTEQAEPVIFDEPARTESSGNGTADSAPKQRQRTTVGEADPKTVSVQVGAPEHAREGARDQTDRPGSLRGSTGHSSGPDLPPPTTVRVGGYTPPERVPPAAAPSAQSRSVRVPRRTNLQLQRLDPWSVLKISLVLSVCGFLVWLVAVGVLYGVLAGMGVWDQINGTYSDLTAANNAQLNTQLISGGRVFGAAFVIGLVNIVLMTALATVGSLVYNVAADFVGGVEVTLSEPD
ncbi:MAG: DUF3566 domain-containing protein [Pseudonocardiaceae bacterium]